MTTYYLNPTNEICPSCISAGRNSLLKKVTEVHDPFPDEEGPYALVSQKCFENRCNYELVISDEWSDVIGKKRRTPYRRALHEQSSINDLFAAQMNGGR